jgi:hydroxymethylglutaryl-CoA reductase
MSSRLSGLYRLALAARRRAVGEARGWREEIWEELANGGLSLDDADHMIENVLATYALPFAVATNFTIDGVDRLVPMVVEEPSVVAAASNAARMARAGGGFSAEVSPPVMIGQVQVVRVPDVDRAVNDLNGARESLLQQARSLVPRLVDRGGGPLDVEVRVLARPPGPDGGVVVVHVHVDCRDAMGANLVNTICEGLADRVAQLAGGEIGLRILSNLTDRRTVRVTCRVPAAALGGDEPDDVAEGIAAASRFAEADPYRAATHNKGILNGIDAVLVATAQDWRAVEAGAHAYASLHGRYAPLATWRIADDGALLGELAMPLAVGTVGGALNVHRGARLALRLAGVETSGQLAAIVGAAGLATNLAALRALATEGIQRGHMSLHARVVARGAGATGELVDRVAAELAQSGDVKPERAREILARLSGGTP